jgi:hypothetical protein
VGVLREFYVLVTKPKGSSGGNFLVRSGFKNRKTRHKNLGLYLKTYFDM